MGWATCEHGHRHWGPRGAAGLLLIKEGRVLLQFRSARVHRGGTWAFPAGAVERGETPTHAAMREAREETGIDPSHVEVLESYADVCGGWTFTTVLATAHVPIEPRSGWEADDHRWVAFDEVARMDLLPAFAGAWGATLERDVRQYWLKLSG